MNLLADRFKLNWCLPKVMMMSKDKPSAPPSRTMAHDNHMPATKIVRPATTGVQGNHTPTTQQAPSAPPPPSPKKK
jgi:hypothetical protein